MRRMRRWYLLLDSTRYDTLRVFLFSYCIYCLYLRLMKEAEAVKGYLRQKLNNVPDKRQQLLVIAIRMHDMIQTEARLFIL